MQNRSSLRVLVAMLLAFGNVEAVFAKLRSTLGDSTALVLFLESFVYDICLGEFNASVLKLGISFKEPDQK